jgi:hypothetical protein
MVNDQGFFTQDVNLFLIKPSHKIMKRRPCGISLLKSLNLDG